MKIWIGVFLAAVGWALAPGGQPVLFEQSRVPTVRSSGLRLLAMSACTEFPSEPLLEPTRDTGARDVGERSHQDTDAPDTELDSGNPDGHSGDGEGIEVPKDARFGELEPGQLDNFCLSLDARAGLPAPSADCDGRTLWTTAISCEVTIERFTDCGITVGTYNACLDHALEDVCALIRAPACAEVFECIGTGLGPDATVDEMTQEDYARLCRWGSESIGENREFICDGIIRVRTHTVADCTDHDRSGCTLTVRDYEACAAELRDDICQVLHAPRCARFRECFGPRI